MAVEMIKKKLKFIRKYLIFFILYSILGWCYEVFLEVVVYQWGFSNRGFLFGPYTPIYGFGALLFIFTIYPLIKNKEYSKKLLYIVPVFLGCMVIATLLELGASYLMEWFTGAWPWQTYESYSYHFQGRIALSPSIRFGLGGLLFLYVIQGFFEFLVSKIKDKHLTILSLIIISILVVDLFYTLLLR